MTGEEHSDQTEEKPKISHEQKSDDIPSSSARKHKPGEDLREDSGEPLSSDSASFWEELKQRKADHFDDVRGIRYTNQCFPIYFYYNLSGFSRGGGPCMGI